MLKATGGTGQGASRGIVSGRDEHITYEENVLADGRRIRADSPARAILPLGKEEM
jgi:hypothetical protein